MANLKRVFPLRVDQDWLDKIEAYREKSESKHEFVLKAVDNEFIKRKKGHDII